MHNAYAHLAECATESARIARGVDATLPSSTATPCHGWDLRELINHWVLHSSYGLEHRALRTLVPDELTARDFTAEPGWPERYAAQLARAVAAWSSPTAREGTVDTGHGSTPAGEMAAMLLMETVLHGWDVARATGQEFRLSGPAAACLLETVEGTAALYRRYEGFAAEVTLPDDASDFERVLALSGRDPRGVVAS
ncbi:TIGR03086 family metal-binding protein [Streptomyces sp. QL37]|uniref:TIGR03086 family metal-binding protein n=1 Tax=Streptomyces sp. QL37 TaxID=2093747 RepID=UPI000CF2AD6D|nr:TIGR03086 family metal-binding protein [Streptomyces sp. QL37]PPQ56698.1 TIGR03086 family protein [Streptomyces sp. QL37]